MSLFDGPEAEIEPALSPKELAIYRKGIADFVSKMSADYRKHNAEAVREDMLEAVGYFGVDPSAFYSGEHDQAVLKAEADLHRVSLYGSLFG